MNRLALAGGKLRRLFTRQFLFVGLAICIVWFFAVQLRGDVSMHLPRLGIQMPSKEEEKVKRMPTHNVLPPLDERVPCYGPRGRLLGQSPDDDLDERELDRRM